MRILDFKKVKLAFTLSEILITLGIIGVLAAMTIPNMISSITEHQCVSGLLKFNSTLQQAVELWKQDIGCDDSAYNCLASQNLADAQISNFDQIAKFMRVGDSKLSGGTMAVWTPSSTLNYAGTGLQAFRFGSGGNGAFLLNDGAVFMVDVDPEGFWILVDVNGKRGPNRMGKDTFFFIVGYENKKNDISYYPRDSADGLCSPGRHAYASCNANNVDPNVDSGASPTSYVILNHKWPDFKGLAAKYPGTFKP